MATKIEHIDELTTLIGAAKIAGITPSAMLKRVKAQGIETYAVGRVLLIRRTDVMMSSLRLGKLPKKF